LKFQFEFVLFLPKVVGRFRHDPNGTRAVLASVSLRGGQYRRSDRRRTLGDGRARPVSFRRIRGAFRP
jgi:hypothetical protein